MDKILSGEKKQENGNKEFENQYYTRILELYKEKSGNFIKVFTLLLGFTLFFFFIILMPYISIQEESQVNAQHLKNTTLNIQHLQKAIDAFRQSQNGIETLQLGINKASLDMLYLIQTLFTQVRSNYESCHKGQHGIQLFQMYPSEEYDRKVQSVFTKLKQQYPGCKDGAFQTFYIYLNNNSTKSSGYGQSNVSSKAYLSFPKLQINSSPSFTHNEIASLPFIRCVGDMEEEFFPNILTSTILCHISVKTKSLLYTYNNTLNQNIISPISSLNNESQLESNLQDLQNRLSIANISRSMSSIFGSTVNETVFNRQGNFSVFDKEFVEAMNTGLDRFWNENGLAIDLLNQQLNSNLQNMNKSLIKMKTEKDDLVANKNDLDEKQKEINQRINQIESPIGIIPLGIIESIIFFPLALGIGFLICSSLLSDTIKLRKELHEWYQKQNPNLEDKKITLITSIWLDPLSSRENILVNFAILSIVFLIFMVSWFIISYYSEISYNKEVGNIFFIGKLRTEEIHEGLYLLSLVFFIIGYMQIISQYFRYRKWKHSRRA